MINSKPTDANMSNKVHHALDKVTMILKDREQLFMNNLNFISSHLLNPIRDYHHLALLHDHINLNKSKHHLFSLSEKNFVPLLPSKVVQPTNEVIRAVSKMIEIVDVAVLHTQKHKIVGITLEFTKTYYLIKGKYSGFVQGKVTVQHFVSELLSFSSKKNLKQINILEVLYQKTNAGHNVSYTEIQNNPELQSKTLKNLSSQLQPIKQQKKRFNSNSLSKRNKKVQIKEYDMEKSQAIDKNQSQILNKGKKQSELDRILRNYSILDLNVKDYSQNFLLYRAEDKQNNSEKFIRKLAEKNKTNQEIIQNYFKLSTERSGRSSRRDHKKLSFSRNFSLKNESKLHKNAFQFSNKEINSKIEKRSSKSSRKYESKIKTKQRGKSARKKSDTDNIYAVHTFLRAKSRKNIEIEEKINYQKQRKQSVKYKRLKSTQNTGLIQNLLLLQKI